MITEWVKLDEVKREFDDIHHLLSFLQLNIVAPTSRFNKFGGFYYRTVEDILSGIKKMLPERATVILSDEIKNEGNRFYVESIASLTYKGGVVWAKGVARETLEKKKWDEPQLTGAASTYARKRALTGLLLLDDNEGDTEIDTLNNNTSTKANGGDTGAESNENNMITNDQATELVELCYDLGGDHTSRINHILSKRNKASFKEFTFDEYQRLKSVLYRKLEEMNMSNNQDRHY